MKVWIAAASVSVMAFVVCFIGGDFEVAIGQVSGAFFVAAWLTFLETVKP